MSENAESQNIMCLNLFVKLIEEYNCVKSKYFEKQLQTA